MASLSPEQVRLVLRRAAELERKHEPGDETVGEAEVSEIASEVGIAPAAVRHALAEVRAGIVKVEPANASFLDKLVGPAHATETRTVKGTVAEVRAKIARFMQASVMQIKRNMGDEGQIWETSPDFWSSMRRAFSFGRQVPFEKGTEISVQVVPRPGVDGEVLVRMTAHLTQPQQRRAWQAAAGAVSGVGMAVAGIVAFHTVGPEVASILAGAGTAAGSLAIVRSSQRRDISECDVAILRFLDGLEHGETEAPAPWQAQVNRFLSRWL